MIRRLAEQGILLYHPCGPSCEQNNRKQVRITTAVTTVECPRLQAIASHHLRVHHDRKPIFGDHASI